MSKVIITGDVNGTGFFTLTSPNSNTSQTLTLPDNSGTFLTDSSAIARSQLPTGSLLQVVSTNKNDAFSTTSTSYVDITGLSVSITPTFASSKILIFVTVGASASADDSLVQLVRGATVIASGTGATVTNGFNMFSLNAGTITNSPVNFLDSPATTSSTTYKVQILTRSGTVFVNRRSLNTSFSGSSSITVMEIAA